MSQDKKETQDQEVKKQEADTSKKKAKKGFKVVKIQCHNAAGKYLLPYNYGQEVELEAKQADEMIEAKDAIAL